MKLQKQYFRDRAREVCLDEEYRSRADKEIIEKTLLLLDGAECVMCFASLEREPSVVALIEHLLAKGVCVALPRCETVQGSLANGIMSAVRIYDLAETVVGAFGIRQPSDDLPILSPLLLDAVVMPCVAADRNGTRLGHGKGYYDRFLSKTDCRTICLCYDRLIFDRLPSEPHDQKPDVVVTEHEVIWATNTANLR